MHRRSAVDLGALPAGVGGAFDLAFLDPPYRKGLVEPCLKSLRDGGWLSDGALVVVETAADEALDLSGWTLVNERAMGAAKMWFLTCA